MYLRWKQKFHGIPCIANFLSQETQLSGDKWDKLLYESAKSSIIFEIIEQEKTIGDIVTYSLQSYFKNVPHDYHRQMVRRVSAVTTEDMTRVATLYLKPLFDPKKCKTTVVCHPSKVAEIGEAFKAWADLFLTISSSLSLNISFYCSLFFLLQNESRSEAVQLSWRNIPERLVKREGLLVNYKLGEHLYLATYFVKLTAIEFF